MLAGFDVERRRADWDERITAAEPPERIWVAERDGLVIGFLHTGPPNDADLDAATTGEIYTVYVAPDAWRSGIGGALMTAADDHWRGVPSVSSLVLWVFEANPSARAFYERLGWEADGARQVLEIGDARPAEIRYRRALTSPARVEPR